MTGFTLNKFGRYTVLLLFVLLATHVYGQNISISPSRVFFTGNPGETVRQTLTFTNASDQEYNFNTRIEDWVRDSIGNKVFSPKGTLQLSNADWIILPSQVISVKPKEKKEVILEMKIPEGASTENVTNSMLFFTQLVPQEDDFVATEANMGVRVLFEFGIHAYYTPPGNADLDVEFTAFEDLGIVTKENTHMRRIGVRLKNVGNVNNDAKVELELTNVKTGQEVAVESAHASLLPRAEQWVFFYIPAQLQGEYLAASLVKLGTNMDTRVAEKEFSF